MLWRKALDKDEVVILGAGITGLTIGYVSGVEIYEAESYPGGICTSYYFDPNTKRRSFFRNSNENDYRFEIGGGHWIFGDGFGVLEFIKSFSSLQFHTRRAAVYLSDRKKLIPYPLQYNLRNLGSRLSTRIVLDILFWRITKILQNNSMTMAEWFHANFGNILYEIFFGPFHKLYTAGLFHEIAFQDSYKTAVDISNIIRGALGKPVSYPGYNVAFAYPAEGLDTLIHGLAKHCNIHYSKKVVKINKDRRIIIFDDGTTRRYSVLISTLPLDDILKMTGIAIENEPATSVLVINIAAVKGENCPKEHWVYIPKSHTGFHRVGFYSHVDKTFLPVRERYAEDKVSIYVEKSYRKGNKPYLEQMYQISMDTVRELRKWKWIQEVEILDFTWIDTAYTWVHPGSKWRATALATLEQHGIYQVGRFARWKFQGIAESVRDGLIMGLLILQAMK